MQQYICIVTSELACASDNFVCSVSFHSDYAVARDYGEDYAKHLSGYPALADYYVYKLVEPYITVTSADPNDKTVI